MLAFIFLVKLPGGWDIYSQESLLNLKQKGHLDLICFCSFGHSRLPPVLS